MNFELFIEEIKHDREIPEIVDLGIEKALNNLSKKNKQKNKRIHTIKLKKLAIAFSVFCVLNISFSIYAMTYFNWSGSIQKRFALDLFDKNLLQNGGFAVNPGMTKGDRDIISAENNGIIISVVQTVADSNNAVIGLRVEGFEIDSSKEIMLDYDILIDGKMVPYASSKSFFYDKDKKYGETILELKINANGNYVESIIGKRIAVDIKGIYYCDNEFSFDELKYDIGGPWHLEWILSGGNYNKEWNIYKEIGDTGMILTYIKLTPISIYMGFIDDSNNSNKDFGFEHDFYGFRLADGSFLYNIDDAGQCGAGLNSGYDYYINYSLTKIINPEEITAVLFIKEIPFDYINPSEDDFYIIELND